MKKILFLLLIVSSILVGCSAGEETITEIDFKNVNDHVKSYIENIERVGSDTETGIYMYNDSKNQRYLYLNQDFLDDGRDFGDVEINADENSFNIYLNDIPISEEETVTYKLYKIKVKEDHEYLKVFKNGEETHFAGVGVGTIMD